MLPYHQSKREQNLNKIIFEILSQWIKLTTIRNDKNHHDIPEISTFSIKLGEKTLTKSKSNVLPTISAKTGN